MTRSSRQRAYSSFAQINCRHARKRMRIFGMIIGDGPCSIQSRSPQVCRFAGLEVCITDLISRSRLTKNGNFVLQSRNLHVYLSSRLYTITFNLTL